MQNIKALFQRVQKLWPMLKLSKKFSKVGHGSKSHHITIIGFLINVQVQGQHPHQWAPFQIAGLLHPWQISHQISRYVYHEGWWPQASTLCNPSLSAVSMSSWATGQNFCMSGKSLSQGTYMLNIKALSQTIQKLSPMLKVSNQQTDRAKTICPRYRYRGHKKTSFLGLLKDEEIMWLLQDNPLDRPQHIIFATSFILFRY